MEQKEPERFRKGDFCKAVTGYTREQLIGFVIREYINPMVEPLEKIRNNIPRVIPRCPAEESADRMLIFTNSKFKANLLDISAEGLYQAFEKFKAHYDYIGHEAYCGSAIYRKIEQAHEQGNVTGLKEGIIELLDKIIHD